MKLDGMSPLDWLISVVLATAGLGLAAMALAESLKPLSRGAVSGIGFGYIDAVLLRLSGTLAQALGPQWRRMLKAHWVTGRPRAEQIAIIRSTLRLGLTAETAAELAEIGNVDPGRLAVAAGKLAAGSALAEKDITLLGRVEAAVEAHLSTAFDLADEAYRGKMRLIASGIAVLLSVLAWAALCFESAEVDLASLGVAVMLGVLAVPIAPIAKDIVSALTAAAGAIRATRL